MMFHLPLNLYRILMNALTMYCCPLLVESNYDASWEMKHRSPTVRLSVCDCVSRSVCVHISFNLLPQTETGVATPPKKPWPPLGGDRRVSGPVPVCSQSGSPLHLNGWILSSLHGYELACLSPIITPLSLKKKRND